MNSDSAHTITDEIRRLQTRIIELEKKQKEQEEQSKIPSVDQCFHTIRKTLQEKKEAIQRNNYYVSVPLAKYYDKQLVSYLESIYYILINMDDRLVKIENRLDSDTHTHTDTIYT
jgi:hypothetical protein